MCLIIVLDFFCFLRKKKVIFQNSVKFLEYVQQYIIYEVLNIFEDSVCVLLEWDLENYVMDFKLQKKCNVLLKLKERYLSLVI